MEWVRFTCCYCPVLRRKAHTLGVRSPFDPTKSVGGDHVKTKSYYGALKPSNFYEVIRPQALKPSNFYEIITPQVLKPENLYKIMRPRLTEAEYAKRRKRAKCRCILMYSSTVQGRDTLL